MNRMIGLASAALAALVFTGTTVAQETSTVRLGLLKFGTVNWEAATILEEGLDEKHGFKLEIVPFAGGDATKVALQAGEVDVITSDWLFASRQRAEGTPLTMVPYSTSIGGIMVPCEAGIASLPDLEGKKIGVAGGPLDKSWLMLQGYAKGQHDFDLKARTEQVFGAPPLLAEKARSGELDAVLNYWHYNAKLEADGFCQLIGAQEAARSLGAKGDISALGYVFNEEWANANADAAKSFVEASRDAKEILKNSDEAWERLRPMMNAEDDKAFETLKARWREGIPSRPVAEEQEDTAKVYDYLAQAGGEKLVGSAKEMTPGTFWAALADGS